MLFFARREKPCSEILSKMLTVYSRFETYKYMGKCLSLSEEDPQQIDELISSYVSVHHKIISSELPISLKANAFKNVTLAKILHTIRRKAT